MPRYINLLSKMFKNYSCHLALLFILPYLLGWSDRSISPFEFGYSEAVSGEERYEVLYKTHAEAIKRGVDVDYKGIDRVELVIPPAARSIPLTRHSDFKNATFYVVNKQKDFYLFALTAKAEEIQIEKNRLATSKFLLPELKGKSVLLSIADGLPWVENRRGYNYGATRRDMIVVKRGNMMNLPIMPYDNTESQPICSWYPLDTARKVFRNIALVRSSDSEYKTFLIKVEGQYNICISSASITTPPSQLFGDYAIKIENSANVQLYDVKIDGTYSLENKYGYGIGMDNVYDVTIKRVQAIGAWGIFGNNNVNTAYLEDCDINRFDIHCYGKDVNCKNTIFRDLYNQFSSLYGTLSYKNCKFIHFVPVLFESSYSAYTHFKLEMLDCEIDVDKERPYLINAGNPAKLAERPRAELSRASWPDIEIKNITINLPDDIDSWNIFQLRGGGGTKMYGISEITVDGLTINGSCKAPRVCVSNKKVLFDRRPLVEVKNSSIAKIEL